MAGSRCWLYECKHCLYPMIAASFSAPALHNSDGVAGSATVGPVLSFEAATGDVLVDGQRVHALHVLGRAASIDGRRHCRGSVQLVPQYGGVERQLQRGRRLRIRSPAKGAARPHWLTRIVIVILYSSHCAAHTERAHTVL